MLKQLRIYYLYVILPFALLMLGAIAYFDAIKSTIVRNPHPQINYTIFVIILIGGTLIIRCSIQLMREARMLTSFSAAIRENTDLATLQEMAIKYDGDISYVLRMIAASGGRPISYQEQTAIEHELVKASSRLTRRNALPQYLTGLLVGMGLLGTFIGLLSTLNDISALIGSFADLDMATANPIVVFRGMIERMKAPMQSMGIAFSASLFGLLGSIILGLMMVAIRRFQGDILSLLGSEVAQHIEFALAHEGFTYSKGALKLGLDQLGANDKITASNVVARPTRPLDLKITVPNGTAQQPVTIGDISVQTAERTSDQKVAGIVDNGSADSHELSISTSGVNLSTGEESRILMRIEERLAENARLQLRTLNSEVEDFQKQRADMLRTLTEHTEASNNFRSELQRVGRQLGTILGIMEKGNNETTAQLSEIMVRIAGDATESHRLMMIQIEEQRKLNEKIQQQLS